jgi:type I restriction enzyme S subunit
MDTKKLRQKVLDLAIRGKLVPQDPNDEPASVLLERIRTEKERLIKKGKIKRSKKSASDDEIEAPFEIPESWEWVRLDDIAYFGGGKTPSMEEKRYWQNGRNLWITSKDMKCDRISDSLMKISDEALPIMTQYNPGTLLMVTRSGILRHSLPIAILEKVATVNQDLKTISFYFYDIAEYIFYSIKAKEKYILKEYHKDGTTVDSINFEKFIDILLPLPSLNEQKRIINEVERWFTLIDELESNEGDLLKTIDKAKSKILDLAIHGKLVPQDPNDEPAIDLLKRINPKFEPCDKENCSFELPNCWEWTTIGEIASSILYGVSESAKDSGNYKLLRITDIQNNKVNWQTVPFTDFDDKKALPYLLQDGDILFARTGATVGKSYLVEGLSQPSIYASYLIRVQTSNLILPSYIKMFFDSGYYWEQITMNSVGIGQPNVNGTILAGLAIPIPPYQEQLRIVAKIEELFAILNSIKESLE